MFLYIFRICSLKILTSWKSRGARAPVPHSWRRQCSSCKQPARLQNVEPKLSRTRSHCAAEMYHLEQASACMTYTTQT